MSKKVALFADVSNLYYCVGKRFEGRKLDYGKYLKQAVASNILFRAFAYGTEINSDDVNFTTCLHHLGYEPKYREAKIIENKDGGREFRKINWNMGIAIDVIRLLDRVDEIILGSSYADMVPLIDYVKEKGVKIVVIACGISKELKRAADQWYEIEETLLEIKNDQTKST